MKGWEGGGGGWGAKGGIKQPNSSAVPSVHDTIQIVGHRLIASIGSSLVLHAVLLVLFRAKKNLPLRLNSIGKKLSVKADLTIYSMINYFIFLDSA